MRETEKKRDKLKEKTISWIEMMKINQNYIRKVLNVVAVFSAFGVNVLANVRPINGLTLGEISNNLFQEVLITPANYAFVIWGVIYLGLFSLAIYQTLPQQQEKPIFCRQISYWLVVASTAQIIWVFLFQLRLFTSSFLAMLLILLPLIRIYSELDIGKRRVSKRERWFVHLPLSIYLAWISVATIVNGAVSLTHIGWKGWGVSPELWTVIMMGVGGAIALVISFSRGDLAFAGVLIWALIAIAVRHWDTPIIAITGVVLSVILLGANLYKQQQTRQLRNFR